MRDKLSIRKPSIKWISRAPAMRPLIVRRILSADFDNRIDNPPCVVMAIVKKMEDKQEYKTRHATTCRERNVSADCLAKVKGGCETGFRCAACIIII